VTDAELEAAEDRFVQLVVRFYGMYGHDPALLKHKVLKAVMADPQLWALATLMAADLIGEAES
jgi:hypothetical protein